MTLGVSRFRFGTRFARLIFDFFGRILDNDESFPRTERVFRSRSARKNVFQTVSVFNRMYESIILSFDRRLLKKNKNYLRIFSDFNRIRTRKKKKKISRVSSHTPVYGHQKSRVSGENVVRRRIILQLSPQMRMRTLCVCFPAR